MVQKIWEELLSETDKEVIRLGHYGQKRGLGGKIALLVIDPQNIYVGNDQPILEQIGEWPSAAGERAWRAAEKIVLLIEECRKKNLTIIYTKNVAKYIEFDGFATKANRRKDIYLSGHWGTDLIDLINPLPGEYVIEKSFASAFYGTPIDSYLNKLKINSLIVCGGTTCGCVRATVVDAVSRNYNVALVQECLFDRIEASHKISLLDMWMKYADVLELQEAIELIRGLE